VRQLLLALYPLLHLVEPPPTSSEKLFGRDTSSIYSQNKNKKTRKSVEEVDRVAVWRESEEFSKEREKVESALERLQWQRRRLELCVQVSENNDSSALKAAVDEAAAASAKMMTSEEACANLFWKDVVKLSYVEEKELAGT
jgi:uncharacterized Zn finger protein